MWDARTGSPLLELKGHTAGVSGVAFSPDGTRAVTISRDNTAKVWDARTGAPLLELKGHTNEVLSVGFSRDGTRIVAGSGDGTARVWDARTGSPLLELKGREFSAWSVAFSLDGTCIVTGDGDLKVKVWNARTGRELKGESTIPPAPNSGQFSPDGQTFARAAHNCVELIRVRPDAEELAYRRFLMEPNFRLYREAYDVAIKSKDDFAARFYLNLLPPRERLRILAEAIVKPLFARVPLREDVVVAFKAQPVADLEVQSACLKLAGSWPESAKDQNNAAWPLVSKPGLPDANYERGLRLAKAACRLGPEDGYHLGTLGVAQYRCGLPTEALAGLTRSNDLHKEKQPAILAFLALAQRRLGQSDKARDTLRRLHGLMKDPQWAENPEARAFLGEAETTELDRVFPTDPFAH